MTESSYREAKALFKPYSTSANLRQKIWAECGKEPHTEFTISRLMQLIGDCERSMVYQACAHLCRKGLLRRTAITTPAATKKDPSKTKEITCVQYVEPWTEKTEKKW